MDDNKTNVIVRGILQRSRETYHPTFPDLKSPQISWTCTRGGDQVYWVYWTEDTD